MFMGVTPTILRPLSVLSAILKPQDVFATKLYTGSNSGQKITTDFAPDFVWIKPRQSATQHFLFDKVRGPLKYLASNLTNAEVTTPANFVVTSFDTDGFTLGNNYNGENSSGALMASWPIKRAPKFFDIVTWTGDGTSNRQIPHGLGAVPGVVIVKRRDAAGDNWPVTHRSLTEPLAGRLFLNNSNAESGNGGATFNGATTTTFTIGNSANVNASGGQFVAYLFAHDPSADGIVQCGSFTGNAAVTLGWQPQFLLFKATSAAEDWWLLDTARGWKNGSDQYLNPNLSSAEQTAGDFGAPTSTGFQMTGLSGASYIYLAIRAPY